MMNPEKLKKQYLKYKLGLVYWFSNTFSYRPQLSSVQRIKLNKDVTVTLTSFPPRIDKLYLVIESLLDQSVTGYKIEVCLSKAEFPGEQIPKRLAKLKKLGVVFRFVDENLKSYKKLFYAYQDNPEQIYVTADDDAYYPHWWLEKLLDKSKDYPGTVICYRSKRMGFDAGGLKPYKSWVDDPALSEVPSLDNFPTGVSGILYPPKAFSDDFLNKDLFQHLAPNADDIWFKITAVMNGTPCIRVFDKSVGFPKVSGSQKISLHKINNQKGQNDIQLDSVFDYFSLSEKNFRSQ